MANITLHIDSEDADAVASFAKLNEQERQLEVQAKKLNLALKEQGLTQKKNAEERKQANREKRIANGWEQAASKAQLDADSRNHKRMIDNKRRLAKEAERTGGAFALMGKAATASLGGILGIGGAVGVFKAITGEIDRLNTVLAESAQRANKQNLGLREFVALQAPGEEGRKFTSDTRWAGANRGLMPDQVGAIAQPIQSMAEKNGIAGLQDDELKQFSVDFEAAGVMNEIGITSEDALKIVTAGRARGQDGRESGDLLSKAAETSTQGPAVFSRSISALGGYSDQKEGLAVLSALTVEQTDTAKLPAAMERLTMVLGKVGELGDTGEFSKKYGLEGLTETEKLAKLYQKGVESGDQSLPEEDRVRKFTALFADEKGISKEQALDLARVVNASKKATSARATLDTDATGSMDAFHAILMDDPGTAQAIIAKRQEALAANNDIDGPQSKDARAEQNKRQQGGLKRMEAGQLDFVDPSTGEEIPFSQQGVFNQGRILNEQAAEYMSSGGGAKAAKAASSISDPALSSDGTIAAQQAFVDALKANAAAMDRNTAATEDQAKANNGRAPVGGSPSNAGEAY